MVTHRFLDIFIFSTCPIRDTDFYDLSLSCLRRLLRNAKALEVSKKRSKRIKSFSSTQKGRLCHLDSPIALYRLILGHYIKGWHPPSPPPYSGFAAFKVPQFMTKDKKRNLRAYFWCFKKNETVSSPCFNHSGKLYLHTVHPFLLILKRELVLLILPNLMLMPIDRTDTLKTLAISWDSILLLRHYPL